jgi:hypothetical protein
LFQSACPGEVKLTIRALTVGDGNVRLITTKVVSEVLEEIFTLPKNHEEPLKFMVGRPSRPVLIIVGVPVPAAVALLPSPDLSFQVVIGAPLVAGTPVALGSDASSHRTHPGTENVVANVFPISDRSDHDVTCPVAVDEMVVVACASNHRDRPGRREGINLSSFKTFAMIYTTSVMYLPEIYVAFITF